MATLTAAPQPLLATRCIALAGNPNAGKTTLFNALTGMRQRVGNYPGVTVEKKEGRCQLVDETEATILDLPGTYSLSPKSPDEEIARDVLLGLRSDTPVPDGVVVVVDASNLERNLYLATQILELGIPTVIALNMSDVAKANGKPVDGARLSRELGAPVVEMVALRSEGLPQLRAALAGVLTPPRPPSLRLPVELQVACEQLSKVLGSEIPGVDITEAETEKGTKARGIALRLLCSSIPLPAIQEAYGSIVAEELAVLRADKALSPAASSAAETKARYAMLGSLTLHVLPQEAKEFAYQTSFTDRADAILTHKIWGLLIFGLIGLLVLQAIFVWASYPMDWIDAGLSWLGDQAVAHLPGGPLRDLLVQGVIAGVGAVITFVPQILILFFFLGLLEDTGYMARAAFLMDRLMSRVGLHGRAFIPLMSSFACAIPGITATRTISNPRDRMTTILIAPFMTCSARVPVYILMISTFIPNRAVGGFLSLRALVMLALYVAGICAAMGMALLFKRTLFKGPPPTLMLELPPYKLPAWRNTLVTMWDRGSQFLKRAGTVIFALSIVLWFLLSYPKIEPAQVGLTSTQVGITKADVPEVSPAAGAHRDSTHRADKAETPGSEGQIINEPSTETDSAREEALAGAQVRHSFAGRFGQLIEPVIAPLGFNWKIGIGLVGAMAAREVFVATLGTVYSVGEADQTSVSLKDAMRRDRWPDGRPVWTTLVAVSVLVYFVLAMQCISTLAVVKRETNSWKWPLFMWAYMTGLAWVASFLVYQGGRLLGFS